MTTILSRVLVYGLALAGISAFAVSEMHASQPVEWKDQTHIITGPNLPGGQAERGQTDTHILYMGLGENCYTETWILPYEYTAINDFVKDNPDAKPDYKVATKFDSRCEKNEYKERLSEPMRSFSYYSDMTGMQRILTFQDQADQDKV